MLHYCWPLEFQDDWNAASAAAVQVIVSRLGPRLPAASLRDLLFPIVWTMVVEYNIAGISGNEDYCAGRAASALAERDDWIQFNALHNGPPTDIEQAESTEKPGQAGVEKHQVWYQELWYLNNADIRSCDISICPDIRVLKLWYRVRRLQPRNPNISNITAPSQSCDIRISWYHSWWTPISEVLWYQRTSGMLQEQGI